MMKQLIYLLLLVVCSSTSYSQQGNDRYTYKKENYSGIGKWYMGREIAYVMGYQGMSWLERDSREKEENTSRLIQNMNIQPEDVIADIGAGSGYHVFKIAPLANKGKVYAVDIQREMLASIKKKQEDNGIVNIERLLGEEKRISLPANSVDKVLMVDVYHEFNYPYEMMQSILKALKPDGKVYLIEYRAEDKSVPIKPLHKMTEAQAVKEMEAVGLKLDNNIENLPWQHCMVFIKQ